MTAYELRRHLLNQHGLRMTGADMGTLLVAHDTQHKEQIVTHQHVDEEEGT